MTAGDQGRNAAQKTLLQGKLHREQAANMHRSAVDLERAATQLDTEAANLEQQAKESDNAESRAQQAMDQFK